MLMIVKLETAHTAIRMLKKLMRGISAAFIGIMN
jgi:hypothetical protein